MNKELFAGCINWITSGELKEHYISDTKEKISEDAAKTNNLKILPVGTFVMAIYGLEADGVRGTCSILRKESTISQACMAFSPKGDILSEFLYSWYKKHGNDIGIRYAQGTKQQNLGYDIVEKFRIAYPAKDEQNALTKFISLLDERIAAQRALIGEMGRLMKGLRKSLISNVTGERLLLRDVASIYQPQTIPQKYFTKEGFPVYGANGIIGKFSSYNHETPQICIACRGTCGAINFSQPKSWITGNAMVVNSDDFIRVINKRYLFHFLSAYDFNSIVSGSGQPQIVREPLGKIKVTLPDIKTQERIARFLDLVVEKSRLIMETSNYFLLQKQYLLRKMFI